MSHGAAVEMDVIGSGGSAVDTGTRDDLERHQRPAIEGYLRAALQAMGEGFVVREEGHAGATLTNSAAADMLGVTREEVLAPYGPSSRFTLHESSGAPVYADNIVSARALASDTVQSAFYHVLRPDGEWRWVRARAVPFRVGLEQRRAVMVTFTDLTEVRSLQQRLEAKTAELAEREAHFRLIATGTRDVVSLSNGQGEFEWVSPSVEPLLGWAPESLVGTPVAALLHPDDVACAAGAPVTPEQAADVPSAAEPAASIVQHRLRKRSGEYLWTETTTTPVSGHAGGASGFLRVTRDVTERREMEARLSQSERLRAVGTLAGGLAHDFNNVLAVVRVTGEQLLEQVRDAGVQEELRTILSATERAQSLTRQMLTFARRQVSVPVVCEADAVLRASEPLFRHLLRAPGQLTLHPDAPGVRVRIDPDELTTAIMNLVSNARDAMTAAGTLVVSTRVVSHDGAREGGSAPADLAAGLYLCVHVRDDGTGMTDEVRDRAFEPFFTTKALGQGTGLGLATVHGVVRNAGGAVSIMSAPDAGTTVTLWLPVVPIDEPPAATAAAPMATRTDGQRPLRMIIVDDEPALCRVIARTVRGRGHHATEAATAAEALAHLEQHGATVDVLITDHLMPGRTGRELIGAVNARWPHVRCALISGYTDDEETREWLETGLVPFLQKPFTLSALDELVEALGVALPLQ